MADHDRRNAYCGIGSWRPGFLQVFNTPSVFLVMFSLSGFAMAIAIGMNSIMMPTLQSLFNLTSTQMGCILISNDVSGFVFALLLGHFCSSQKIRWITFGMLVTILSAAIQTLPQAFVMLPEPDLGNMSTTVSDVVCSGDTPNIDTGVTVQFYAVENNKLFWIFFLGGFLMGLGNTPAMLVAPTYLDEIMTQKKLGPAIAIMSVIYLLGFPVCYVLGSTFLKMYVTLSDAPEGVSPGSPQWVGAWWLGYFIPGVLIVIFGLPLVLFPQQMPSAKKVLNKKIMRGETTADEKSTELKRSVKELVKDTLPAMKRMFYNYSLMFLIMGDSLFSMFLGSMAYDPKLYSLMFKRPPAAIGNILAAVRLSSILVGLLIGGVSVGKFNLTGKQCMGIVAVVSLLSTPLTALNFVYCDQDSIVGVDVPYFKQSEIRMLAECNSNCNCDTGFYKPVCDIKTNSTYFSPCHAGCSEQTEKNPKSEQVMYDNCTCTGPNSQVILGACGEDPKNCEMKVWLVMTGLFFEEALFFMGIPALGIALLRVVPETDRSAAQGLKQFMVRIIGFVPGPILFGKIIDSYCSVWRETGGNQGNCWLYDLKGLIFTFTMCQIAIRTCSLICSSIAWKLYPERSAYTPIELKDIKN